MTALVTVDRAKLQLRIIGSALDGEIAKKIEEASAIVLDYVTTEGKESWTAENVPGVVSSAVLLVLGALWSGRAGAEDAPQPLSDAVRNLLRRHRDPALA